jgi:hypothetical protein
LFGVNRQIERKFFLSVFGANQGYLTQSSKGAKVSGYVCVAWREMVLVINGKVGQGVIEWRGSGRIVSRFM